MQAELCKNTIDYTKRALFMTGLAFHNVAQEAVIGSIIDLAMSETRLTS